MEPEHEPPGDSRALTPRVAPAVGGDITEMDAADASTPHDREARADARQLGRLAGMARSERLGKQPRR